jgi:hypothetical protein
MNVQLGFWFTQVRSVSEPDLDHTHLADPNPYLPVVGPVP